MNFVSVVSNNRRTFSITYSVLLTQHTFTQTFVMSVGGASINDELLGVGFGRVSRLDVRRGVVVD